MGTIYDELCAGATTRCPSCHRQVPPDAGRECPYCYARLDLRSLPPATRADRLAVALLFGGIAGLVAGLVLAGAGSAAGAAFGIGGGLGLLVGAFFALPHSRR